MPSPAAWNTLVLEPELAALAAEAPAAARERRRRMASNAGDFIRGSLGLAARWLALNPLADAPWVWSAGDAHQGNFSTLATGRADRHGIVPVTYDVSDVDDEHPAPWWWDHARLLASLPAAAPDLGRRDLTEFAMVLLTDYQRTLAKVADGDDLALRLDLHGLPEVLKRMIEDESADGLAERHLADFVARSGDRLQRGQRADDDAKAAAAIIPAITAALAKRSDVTHTTVLDLARRTTGGGLASLGRRRWWVLISEEHRRGLRRLRLLELRERRPSTLAGVLPVQPFAPRQTTMQGLTVAMGGDPCQRSIHLGASELLLRTRCHTRKVIDLTVLDAGDRRRLACTWGQLLARFHVNGWTLLGRDAAEKAAAVAVDAARRGTQVAERARDLTRLLTSAHAAFSATAKSTAQNPTKSTAMAGQRRGK